MLLRNLLGKCGLGDAPSGVNPDLEVLGVSSDSRSIKKDWVFVAIHGYRVDGASFAADALRNGACIVVTECDIPSIDQRYVLHTKNARLTYALLLAACHEEHKNMRLAAVTGTDGKTSVTHYYYHMLLNAGINAAKIGTLGAEWSADKRVSGHSMTNNTTPDALVIHDLLREFYSCGINDVCMEATSQGLDMSRLDGIRFKVAGFTNLTSDHLEYHNGKQNYFSAKMRLFSELLADDGVAIVNADDASYKDIVACCGSRRILSYGSNEAADLRILDYDLSIKGLSFTVNVNERIMHGRSTVFGSLFNLSNILCALGMVAGRGEIELEEVLEALPKIPSPPGRMEIIGHANNTNPVIIDYAHTPNALENVLRALKSAAPGRVLVVFGCGGDRDRSKRPIMGSIAARYADVVIVTDDNPRSEDPELIRSEIMAQCPGAHSIADRSEAIAAGLSMLQPNDALLLAGKGAEQSQIIGDNHIPHNDAQVALALMHKMA